jgi:hypothetical protein
MECRQRRWISIAGSSWGDAWKIAGSYAPERPPQAATPNSTPQTPSRVRPNPDHPRRREVARRYCVARNTPCLAATSPLSGPAVRFFGEVSRTVSGPRTTGARPFTERLADYNQNPGNWKAQSIHTEPATGVRTRGGVSEQIFYRHANTGETLLRHRVNVAPRRLSGGCRRRRLGDCLGRDRHVASDHLLLEAGVDSTPGGFLDPRLQPVVLSAICGREIRDGSRFCMRPPPTTPSPSAPCHLSSPRRAWAR